MDEPSVLLVLSLQLEDIDALLHGSNAENPVDRSSDVAMALAAYRNELLNNKLIIEDCRMGRSIADAVRKDGAIIAAARVEEQTATRDRELACHLGGVELPKQLTSGHLSEPDIGAETLRHFSTLNSSAKRERDNREEERGGSSSKRVQALGDDGSSIPRKQCVACQEDKPKFDTLEAPCTHIYCRGCVSGFFEAATTDESLFPPRCCRQEITLKSVTMFLSAPLVRRFRSKAVELTTPNRTYCVWPTCSTFIPEECISRDKATCPACQQQTCATCKTASHEGDCPNDTALQSLLTTAAAKGWQRCYACRRIVELDLGCDHITSVSRITHSWTELS